MKKILFLSAVIIAFNLSCTQSKNAAEIEAKLLADKNFTFYIASSREYIASGRTEVKAEKKSSRYYQQLRKDYVSTKLMTADHMNAIIARTLSKAMQVDSLR